MTRLGVLSDTHGRFDPALREVFAGVERIVHAGDVGAADVLAGLATIAPVTAVRGNVDVYFGAEQLPEEVVSRGRRAPAAGGATCALRCCAATSRRARASTSW